MTAVYTITLICNGGSPLAAGCPTGARLIVESSSSGLARKEAASQHGWSVRYGGAASPNARKILDMCPDCDPVKRKRNARD